jgi:hypothetical protein
MAWSNQSATQLTNITTEQFFSFGGSTHVAMNPGETHHLQVKMNPPASPTDDMVVSVYSSPDGGTTYDDTPFIQFSVSRTPDPDRASVSISGIRGYKVGVKRSGSTDTITDADAILAKDGVSL